MIFSGLPSCAGGLGEDFPLLGDGRRIEVLLARAPSGRMAATCMQMSLASSAVAALDLQEHADGAVVMGVAAAGAVDPHQPLQLEDLADAVVQVVELLLEACACGWLGDGWARSSSALAAPGPVANCRARSLANCTN